MSIIFYLLHDNVTRSSAKPTPSVVMDSESATESADFCRVVRIWICRFFCGRKGRCWVVCSPINIYLSGGGVQATLHNTVAAGHCHRLIEKGGGGQWHYDQWRGGGRHHAADKLSASDLPNVHGACCVIKTLDTTARLMLLLWVDVRWRQCSQTLHRCTLTDTTCYTNRARRCVRKTRNCAWWRCQRREYVEWANILSADQTIPHWKAWRHPVTDDWQNIQAFQMTVPEIIIASPLLSNARHVGLKSMLRLYWRGPETCVRGRYHRKVCRPPVDKCSARCIHESIMPSSRTETKSSLFFGLA